MAGDACLHKAGREDLSFLGHGIVEQSCRYRMAILEFDGFHARGAAGSSHPAAEVQVELFGGALFERGAARAGDRTRSFGLSTPPISSSVAVVLHHTGHGQWRPRS